MFRSNNGSMMNSKRSLPSKFISISITCIWRSRCVEDNDEIHTFRSKKRFSQHKSEKDYMKHETVYLVDVLLLFIKVIALCLVHSKKVRSAIWITANRYAFIHVSYPLFDFITHLIYYDTSTMLTNFPSFIEFLRSDKMATGVSMHSACELRGSCMHCILSNGFFKLSVYPTWPALQIK